MATSRSTPPPRTRRASRRPGLGRLRHDPRCGRLLRRRSRRRAGAQARRDAVAVCRHRHRLVPRWSPHRPGLAGLRGDRPPGDFTGDGAADVLARKPDGTLWLYAGNGRGGWAAAGRRIGLGWQVFDRVLSPGDFTGDGAADVLARKPDGTLWLYPGNGGAAGPPRAGGSAWAGRPSPTSSLRGPHRRRPIRRAGVAHRRHPPRLPRERSRRLGLRRPDDCSGLGQCRAGDRHPLGTASSSGADPGLPLSWSTPRTVSICASVSRLSAPVAAVMTSRSSISTPGPRP